jgi:hypothetical protein
MSRTTRFEPFEERDTVQADQVGPGGSGDDGTAATVPPAGGRRRRPTTLVVAVCVAVAVIAALVAVLLWPDGDGGTATDPTTETTATPTTEPTTEPTTDTTDAPDTTVAPAPVDTSTAVFPYATGDLRFDDPVAAARGFAVDFLGFADPVVGEFMAGDSRSGEVEVRPQSDGPVTIVMVRQLGADGTWWVLGSATADVAVDSPAALAAVTSPLTVTGRALAFEGNVSVEVRQDGSTAALGSGFVTGGGDVMRPFGGQVEFSAPTAERGTVVFLTHSAENGQVWSASTVRVQFG